MNVRAEFLKLYQEWRAAALAKNPDATEDEISEDAYIEELLDGTK